MWVVVGGWRCVPREQGDCVWQGLASGWLDFMPSVCYGLYHPVGPLLAVGLQPAS